MEYRRDIDGLRSIAVLLVVFYHFGFTNIPGGFVGVDIFFVISGYLITNIIYKEAIAGHFDIKNFYSRRIRRLLPALFAVLIVSIVAFSFVLVPTDYINFAKSIIWINFYLANIFFWRKHGNYFDGGSEEAPLLHTWSLAVEEQYYLFWPLYIVLGLSLLNRRNFFFVTSVLFVASIYFSEVATKITIGAAYYLLPSRAFELMMGSLLALMPIKAYLTNRPLNSLLSILGVGLIAYSAIYLTKNHSFPGYNAIYPTLGSALLIYSGYSNPGIINRLFALTPFVSIGLISYSLYLWHWPIIVFAKYTAIDLTPQVRFGLIGAAIIISWLSWKYIEIPFRRKRGPSRLQPLLAIYAVPVLLFISFSSLVIYQKGFEERFDTDIIAMDAAHNSRPNKFRKDCHSALRNSSSEPNNSCVLGSSSMSAKKAFMFGDSIANHYTGFMDELAKSGGVKIMDYTLDSCPPIFDLYVGASEFKASKCKARNDLVRKYLRQEHKEFDYVVIAANWPTPNHGTMFNNHQRIISPKERENLITSQLIKTLQAIVNEGMTPVIIKNVPTLSNSKPNCPIKKKLFNSNLNCETTYTPDSFMDQIVVKMERIFPELISIEPKRILCHHKNNSCVSEIDGIPLYRDNSHLNDVGSRKIALEYAKQFGNPFQKSL